MRPQIYILPLISVACQSVKNCPHEINTILIKKKKVNSEYSNLHLPEGAHTDPDSVFVCSLEMMPRYYMKRLHDTRRCTTPLSQSGGERSRGSWEGVTQLVSVGSEKIIDTRMKYWGHLHDWSEILKNYVYVWFQDASLKTQSVLNSAFFSFILQKDYFWDTGRRDKKKKVAFKRNNSSLWEIQLRWREDISSSCIC